MRRAAIALQRGANTQDRVGRLVELLDDPVRSVRIDVARYLIDAPIARLPRTYSEQFAGVIREFQASLRSTADFPETQMVLGGVALTIRQFQAANAAFREATEMDPQLEQAWLMQARILSAFERQNEAIAVLEKANKANPNSILIYQALLRMRDSKQE